MSEPIDFPMRRAWELLRMGNLAEAASCCRAALDDNPGDFDAAHLGGIVAAREGRLQEAEALFERAIAIDPRSAEAHANHGNVRTMLGRFADALASVDRALAINPNSAAIQHNRGAALLELGRYREALESCDRACALEPAFAEALNNRGSALRQLGRLAEALASYERALSVKPHLAEALHNRGIVLALLERHDEAAKAFARALEVVPGLAPAQGALLYAKMHCCDWRGHAELSARVLAEVRASGQGSTPFALLASSGEPADQLRCARAWAREHYPSVGADRFAADGAAHSEGSGARSRRIRLAYVSAELHDHAISRLMAGLFESHDRSRFETIAISLGLDKQDAMRTRLKSAFERFVDAHGLRDVEVAKLIRELQVDIAVDLNGYTGGCRPGIFAHRPAPIQVSYLAYPGTMGADYIDYVVADRVVIPPAQQDCYAEKVVYLPESYQVNDAKRRIAERTPSRTEVGLPESGFVFCSFNNTYKITPEVFDLWMRLLRQVEGSVLWLLQSQASVPGNLRREAEARGVAGERLVFAPKIAHAQHLARHRLADLFIDTLPYNAHTTASDALWAGLPVLTRLGTTFAGRVAGSLLQAIGMPELITHTAGEYERLALELARDEGKLGAVREKLSRHRESWPLFDTQRTRRHLEAAYVAMWERWQRGESPAAFAVAPEDCTTTVGAARRDKATSGRDTPDG